MADQTQAPPPADVQAPPAAAPAPAADAAPAPDTTTPAPDAAPQAGKSEIQKDVDFWVSRASNATANFHEFQNAPGTGEWSSGFFSCFSPVDTCLITCCCPCITFGKTHHRLHKDANLKGYSVVNGSCLGWWATACFGVHCIGNLLSRHEIRQRSNPQLKGDFVTDFLKAWCCNCCDLIQLDKEAEHLLKKEAEAQVVSSEPVKQEPMSYPQ